MPEETFQECMSRKLKGNLAGKSKSRREAIFRAAAKSCTGKSGSRSKSKSKSRKKSNPRKSTTRSRSTVRSVRTIVKQKVRSRAKGKLERTRLKFKKEFDDIARALGVPLSKTTFKIVGNQWVLRAGKVKAKRVKLGEAMRLFRKNARKRL